MGEKKYHVIKEDEARAYIKWVKQRLIEWHDFKPDYIGVTETAATPLGFLIKAAWKKAYPGETTPRFLRIDHNQAQRLYFNDDSLPEQEVERRYNEYAKSISHLPHNEKTKILFLDEVNSKCAQDSAMVLEKVWNLSSKNIRADEGKPEIYNVFGAAHFPESYESQFEHVRPTVKRGPNSKNMMSDIGYNLRARILHDSKYRGKALSYIRDVKLAGQEAGEEIHADIERKGKLEQRVASVTAVSGILGGVIFLFSNSKNIQLSPGIELLKNSNIFIGVGLLIIGLVAGLFWMRGRK